MRPGDDRSFWGRSGRMTLFDIIFSSIHHIPYSYSKLMIRGRVARIFGVPMTVFLTVTSIPQLSHDRAFQRSDAGTANSPL